MRLSALLMVGEDIPMTAMNVWVLSYQTLTSSSEVSTMVFASFAFNLIMLGTRRSRAGDGKRELGGDRLTAHHLFLMHTQA